MPKTICIYHANCLDGFTSAWLLDKAIPDSQFIPGEYNKPLDMDILTGADVYFVDFSVKRDVMKEIIAVANKVVVLDHHETAQQELEGLDKEFDNVEIVFDMNRSGAMITYDYFDCSDKLGEFRFSIYVREIVEWVQDRDLWRFEKENTREIAAYMFSLDQTFENWNELAKRPVSAMVSGDALLRKQKKDIDALYDDLVREISFEGHTIAAANVPWMFASDLGNMMVTRGGYPMSLTYYEDNNGYLRCSLRADGKVNVAEIAKRYGGGGHPNAAGFKIPITERSSVGWG